MVVSARCRACVALWYYRGAVLGAAIVALARLGSARHGQTGQGGSALSFARGAGLGPSPRRQRGAGRSMSGHGVALGVTLAPASLKAHGNLVRCKATCKSGNNSQRSKAHKNAPFFRADFLTGPSMTSSIQPAIES